MSGTISLTHGLVTHDSSTGRHVSPQRRAGLTKLKVPAVAALKWQPSLSPFTFVGFCLCATELRLVKGLAALKEARRMKALALMGLFLQMANDRRTTQSPHEGSLSWNQAQPDLITSFPTPQSGLANGPEWAALKKHNRMRTTDACVPDLVEVLEQEWWDCDNALAPIPMNRPSMALGDRNDRRASILEQ